MTNPSTPPLPSGDDLSVRLGELLAKATTRWEACDEGDYGDFDGKSRVMLGDDASVRVAVFHHGGSEVNRSECDANIELAVAMHEALPQLLADRAALNAKVEEARGVIRGLNAHMEAMQARCELFLAPEVYTALNGMVASARDDALMRDKLFISDTIYMLDGPQQREAQGAARAYLTKEARDGEG